MDDAHGAGGIADRKAHEDIRTCRDDPRREGGNRIGTSGWVTLTDAKGNYTLNIAPGAYGLSAWHPAYEVRGTDISVTSGQASSKELTLSPMARVSGMVLNDERKPVVAAQVAGVNASEGLDFQMRMGLSSG